jgi:hypothetical protein
MNANGFDPIGPGAPGAHALKFRPQPKPLYPGSRV